MHFSKSLGNFERQLPLKKGIRKFQRHLPLKLNQSPSKLGSLPVEVIGFSSQGQNAYRPLVSEFAANTPHSYSKTAIRLLVEMKLFRSL